MHSVAAALANPRRTCAQLLVTEQALETLTALLRQHASTHPAQGRLAKATLTPKRAIDKLHKACTTHQSLSLKCHPLPPPPLSAFVETLRAKTTTLVMLDRVQDPHNIGAILRSARFFKVQALLLAKGHAPQENASIAKAACGALEDIPILYTNLAQALTTLGKKGWSRIAFDAHAQENAQEDDKPQDDILSAEHKVLVFGAEGKGLRRLVRQHCDHITRIAGGDGDESLNVSNAVAVALALAGERQKNR